MTIDDKDDDGDEYVGDHDGHDDDIDHDHGDVDEDDKEGVCISRPWSLSWSLPWPTFLRMVMEVMRMLGTMMRRTLKEKDWLI